MIIMDEKGWKKLGKRLGIKRDKICAQLFLFSLLVIYGIKPAYLVDACALTIEQAELLVTEVCKACKKDNAHEIVRVVQVNEDIFIINRPLLLLRMQSIVYNLSVVEEPTSSYPESKQVIVSLDHQQRSSAISEDAVQIFPFYTSNQQYTPLCSPTEDCNLYQVINILLQTFMETDPSQLIINISSDSEAYRKLGGPFIAGLFLGYPCIYKAPPSVDVTGDSLYSDIVSNSSDIYAYASSKLSYKTLMKVTISAELCVSDRFLSGQLSPSRASDTLTVPIYEFSYPFSLIGTETTVEEKLRRIAVVVDAFFASLSPASVDYSGSEPFIHIQTWHVDRHLWETEGISL